MYVNLAGNINFTQTILSSHDQPALFFQEPETFSVTYDHFDSNPRKKTKSDQFKRTVSVLFLILGKIILFLAFSATEKSELHIPPVDQHGCFADGEDGRDSEMDGLLQGNPLQ